MKGLQADEYLQEAELTLTASEVIFNRAKEIKKNLWAQVVKNAYDAMEHAISAALAMRRLMIPKDHPEKVTKFVNNFNLRNSHIEKLLMKWVGKRGQAQYVDIRGGKLMVPHEIFDEQDAEEALRDAKEVIEFVRKLLKKID